MLEVQLRSTYQIIMMQFKQWLQIETKTDKANNLLYITVDLQQTMPLPKIPTSKAFYLRQIWFYNLGIHVVDGDKEKAFCCTWTEDVADRGSCEVASALLRFCLLYTSVLR